MLIIIIILPSIMRRQQTTKTLSYSTVSDPTLIHQLPNNYSNSYYFSRPPTNHTSNSSHSNQKLQQRSHEKTHINYDYQMHKSQSTQMKNSEMFNVRQRGLVDYKQNTNNSNHQLEGVIGRLKEMQYKMKESDNRIALLERGHRSNNQLSKAVQQIIKNQLAEISFKQGVQDRFNELEKIVGGLTSQRGERRQIEPSSEGGRYSGVVDKVNQLSKHSHMIDNEINQINLKFQRVVSKIQGSFSSMGSKYEQFIESNIIKSIEHVNKLTHHYHEEIEKIKAEQSVIAEKVEQLLSKKEADKKQQDLFGHKLMKNYNSHIRIVQTICFEDDRKLAKVGSRVGIKQTIKQLKQQLKQSEIGTQYADSPRKTFNSQNIISSLYDSIEQSNQPHSAQISMQKIIYKLDNDFNLLDEQNRYLLDTFGRQIRLDQAHIAQLREYGLI